MGQYPVGHHKGILHYDPLVVGQHAIVASRLVVVGASDHAAVVLDLIEMLDPKPSVVAVVDSSPAGNFVGSEIAGYLVEHTVDDVPAIVAGGAVVLAVGDCRERAELDYRMHIDNVSVDTLVHPSGNLARDTQLGPGTLIAAGVLVQTGTTIGRAVIINTGAIIDHHCTIRNYSHVGPGARLAGNVSVGARAFIGIGAIVIDGVTIGDGAVVGAGAVVISNVRPGATVVGVPARELRGPSG